MKALTRAQLYLAAPGIKVIVLTTLLVPLGVMVTGALNASSIAGYTMAGWILGFLWSVAALFAAEFELGTMGVQLSQPVERAIIYRTKMGVVCGLGLLLIGINLLLGVYGVLRSDTCFMVVAIILWGISITPIMALLGKSCVAALVFTAALGLVTFQFLIVAFAGRRAGGLLLTVFLCAAPFLIILGRQMFHHLELVSRDKIQWKFSHNSSSVYKSWRHAFWSKEFMNHRFSIRAGLVFTLVTLTCSLIWLLIRDHQNKSWAGDVVATAWVLQICLVPLLTSLSAIAEEVSSRTQHLDILLPAFNKKKWAIKLLVAFLITVVFSFIIPMAIGLMLNKMKFPISHPVSGFPYFLSITLTSFTAGTFAASVTCKSPAAFFLGLGLSIAGFTALIASPVRDFIHAKRFIELAAVWLAILSSLYFVTFRLYYVQDTSRARAILNGLVRWPWEILKILAALAFFFEPRPLNNAAQRDHKS